MEESKKDIAPLKPKKAKPKKEEKNVIISKLQTFYTNISSEFKKIIWPKKEELAKQTVIVIVICGLFGAVIFGMDAVFGALLKVLSSTI